MATDTHPEVICLVQHTPSWMKPDPGSRLHLLLLPLPEQTSATRRSLGPGGLPPRSALVPPVNPCSPLDVRPKRPDLPHSRGAFSDAPARWWPTHGWWGRVLWVGSQHYDHAGWEAFWVPIPPWAGKFWIAGTCPGHRGSSGSRLVSSSGQRLMHASRINDRVDYHRKGRRLCRCWILHPTARRVGRGVAPRPRLCRRTPAPSVTTGKSISWQPGAHQHAGGEGSC